MTWHDMKPMAWLMVTWCGIAWHEDNASGFIDMCHWHVHSRQPWTGWSKAATPRRLTDTFPSMANIQTGLALPTNFLDSSYNYDHYCSPHCCSGSSWTLDPADGPATSWWWPLPALATVVGVAPWDVAPWPPADPPALTWCPASWLTEAAAPVATPAPTTDSAVTVEEAPVVSSASSTSWPMYTKHWVSSLSSIIQLGSSHNIHIKSGSETRGRFGARSMVETNN